MQQTDWTFHSIQLRGLPNISYRDRKSVERCLCEGDFFEGDFFNVAILDHLFVDREEAFLEFKPVTKEAVFGAAVIQSFPENTQRLEY